MGFNGARKHQKVEDPRWLDWADRLGFLVWGEMASVRERSATSERRFKSEWTDAVRRDRDHPCIVAWAPVNESDGLGLNPAPFLDELYHLGAQVQIGVDRRRSPRPRSSLHRGLGARQRERRPRPEPGPIPR